MDYWLSEDDLLNAGATTCSGYDSAYTSSSTCDNACVECYSCFDQSCVPEFRAATTCGGLHASLTSCQADCEPAYLEDCQQCNFPFVDDDEDGIPDSHGQSIDADTEMCTNVPGEDHGLIDDGSNSCEDASDANGNALLTDCETDCGSKVLDSCVWYKDAPEEGDTPGGPDGSCEPFTGGWKVNTACPASIDSEEECAKGFGCYQYSYHDACIPVDKDGEEIEDADTCTTNGHPYYPPCDSEFGVKCDDSPEMIYDYEEDIFTIHKDIEGCCCGNSVDGEFPDGCPTNLSCACGDGIVGAGESCENTAGCIGQPATTGVPWQQCVDAAAFGREFRDAWIAYMNDIINSPPEDVCDNDCEDFVAQFRNTFGNERGPCTCLGCACQGNIVALSCSDIIFPPGWCDPSSSSGSQGSSTNSSDGSQGSSTESEGSSDGSQRSETGSSDGSQGSSTDSGGSSDGSEGSTDSSDGSGGSSTDSGGSSDGSEGSTDSSDGSGGSSTDSGGSSGASDASSDVSGSSAGSTDSSDGSDNSSENSGASSSGASSDFSTHSDASSENSRSIPPLSSSVDHSSDSKSSRDRSSDDMSSSDGFSSGQSTDNSSSTQSIDQSSSSSVSTPAMCGNGIREKRIKYICTGA